MRSGVGKSEGRPRERRDRPCRFALPLRRRAGQPRPPSWLRRCASCRPALVSVLALDAALCPDMARFRLRKCTSDGYGTLFFACGATKPVFLFKAPVQRFDGQSGCLPKPNQVRVVVPKPSLVYSRARFSAITEGNAGGSAIADACVSLASALSSSSALRHTSHDDVPESGTETLSRCGNFFGTAKRKGGTAYKTARTPEVGVRVILLWWRRGESNSGPYYILPEALQAYPLIAFGGSGGSPAGAAPSSRFDLSFGHTDYVPKRIPLR